MNTNMVVLLALYCCITVATVLGFEASRPTKEFNNFITNAFKETSGTSLHINVYDEHPIHRFSLLWFSPQRLR